MATQSFRKLFCFIQKGQECYLHIWHAYRDFERVFPSDIYNVRSFNLVKLLMKFSGIEI